MLLLCPQCESQPEPLDTQCIEPQELREYQKTQTVKEEAQLEIIPSNPEDKQSLMDIKINNEEDIEQFPNILLPDATSLKDLGADVSALAPSYIPRHVNGNVSESPESQAPLMSEQLLLQESEDSAAKDKISDITNKMEEIVTGTPDELCGDSFSALKPADNPLLPKGEIEQKMTKSHQQIIEKIRHYYEAAEAVAEEGQVSRRNSFSNIPAGLVKDSVSRFNFFVHQVSVCDSESGRSDSNDNGLMPTSPAVPDPNAKPDDTSTDAEVAHNNQGQSNTESNSGDGEQICDFKPCMELWKEKERKVSGIQESSKVYACEEGRFGKDKDVSEKDPFPTTDRKTPVLNEQFEPELDHNEYVEPKNPEQRDKTIEEVQSTVVPGDMRQDPKGSLDGLPSQIKVGRFSRHGKTVTYSRTLYEGIADVSSLEFFETAPMDQCLVENSEKILSKVQMLAQMYMAKSSSMKVPLHQKRTRFTQGPCKVTTPPKSQILLHQAEVKTQNQLSGET